MQSNTIRLSCALLGRSTSLPKCASKIPFQFKCNNLTLTKNYSQTAAANATANTETDKWDLYVGLCLERRPVITKDRTPLEEKYAAFLAQYEVELSKKSDHEIRREDDA